MEAQINAMLSIVRKSDQFPDSQNRWLRSFVVSGTFSPGCLSINGTDSAVLPWLQ